MDRHPDGAGPITNGTSETIEIHFPEMRAGKPPLLFKVPTPEEIAVSANRLLKFAFPPAHMPKTYLRLLSRHLNAPGVNRRELEALPLHQLEMLYTRLWQAGLHVDNQSSASDCHYHQMMISLLACEFDQAKWVREDIRQLVEVPDAELHGYYTQQALPDTATLNRVLEAAGYRERISDETAALPGYLSIRHQRYILPWTPLLESRDVNNHLPNLLELQRLARLLPLPSIRNSEPDIQSYSKQLLQLKRAELRETVERPVRLVMIVEGVTEEILIPAFARLKGLDLHQLGIRLVPAGGKNQVAALYRDLADMLAIPIITVLDSDALQAEQDLLRVIRPNDQVFVIPEGEIEDLYSPLLVTQVLNRHYTLEPGIGLDIFQQPLITDAGSRRVEQLNALWRHCGLETFDKIHFAGKLADYLRHYGIVRDIHPTMERLLALMMQTYPSSCTTS
jgi:hypothetical protein